MTPDQLIAVLKTASAEQLTEIRLLLGVPLVSPVPVYSYPFPVPVVPLPPPTFDITHPGPLRDRMPL